MKSLKESLFDSKTQTMESLFDRDLISKITPSMLKYGFIDKIKNIYDKYGINFEIYANGNSKYESIIIPRNNVLYETDKGICNIFDFNFKGQPFKYHVFFQPEIAIAKDEYLDDGGTWRLFTPMLWFEIRKCDGTPVSTPIQVNCNKFAEIKSLRFDSKSYHSLNDKEAMENYLDRLENAIFVFKSDYFKIKIQKIIDKYNNGGKPVPTSEVKKLADKL